MQSSHKSYQSRVQCCPTSFQCYSSRQKKETSVPNKIRTIHKTTHNSHVEGLIRSRIPYIFTCKTCIRVSANMCSVDNSSDARLNENTTLAVNRKHSQTSLFMELLSSKPRCTMRPVREVTPEKNVCLRTAHCPCGLSPDKSYL